MFATGTPARADVLDELLRRAIALHRQNRYVEAGRLYDEALALSPDLPDALHMRGAVDLSLGDAAAAIRRIEQLAVVVWVGGFDQRQITRRDASR